MKILNVRSLTALTLLVGALTLAGPSGASAQVIIQGEVTAYPSQPAYGQPQPIYAQPQPTYASPYTQQPPVREQRYIHHSESLRALWVPGILAFAGGFLFSVFADLAVGQECSGGYAGGCPNETWSYLTWIPLVGPWLGLTIGEARDYAWVNYVGGILQGVGAVMFILGLAIQDEWDEPIALNPHDPMSPTLAFDAGPTGGSVTLAF